MNLSLQDSARYTQAIADMAHLIKEFSAHEVIQDLRVFFPDQYEELITAARGDEKKKKIARLLGY
jgi:hypothetical protein